MSFKTSASFLALTLISLPGAHAAAADRPHVDAWSEVRAAAPARAPAGPFVVAARDPRGVPSLVWRAPGAAPPAHLSAAAAARHHLRQQRGLYGVGARVIAGAQVRFTHDTGRGGVIVGLRQTVGGVDVFHGDIKVLLDRAHRLIGISGTPHPAAHAGHARPFALDRLAAVRLALRDLHGPGLADPVLVPRGGRDGWEHLDLGPTTGLRFDQPARVKPVYFPVGDGLVPAHLVEVQTSTAAGRDVYQYVLAADDGRLLYRNDATAYDAYTYRVWADPDGRPHDGPIADWTPHPTGTPEGGPPPFTPPLLLAMEGFNTHGDPWLPPGATDTRGNNCDAYVDHSSPDGLGVGEYRADVTAPSTFDRVYDPFAEPLASQDQSKASITQIFYVVNWLHDWWYDSGFDEAAGNAQFENYGRGGEGGDPLLAEAQDAALLGNRNNANMTTPLDGMPPRMQMYLWTSQKKGTLEVQPLNQNFAVGMASFGAKNYDVTGELVLVDDGMDPNPHDGCTAPLNSLTDKIVLVDRGNCTFETKVNLAQSAGALGVVIANNVDAQGVLTPGNDNNMPDPIIPTQGIFKPAGEALKAALQDGPQTAHMTGETGIERDGTLDNMIVAHEWGHYIHHRLVDCGSRACRAMSEGWADWFGLHMSLRAGDDLDGTYACSIYAAPDTSGYFGIRRVPYSVSASKNALSFRHIAKGEALPQTHPMSPGPADNSEVHNAGEIWASMLWEAYVALHKVHAGDMTFDEVRRLMGDYVVAGMMMTPIEPTFTQQRDAILLAVGAVSTDDMLTVASAFAARGAGTCAVSPPITSTDFVGVVEDLSVQADAWLTTLTADDTVMSCDHDGVVDAHETGAVRVEVMSRGPLPMPAGTVVEVVDPDPALVFPNGTSVQLDALAPLAVTQVAIAVTVADDLADYKPITLTVRVTAPEGCAPFTELAVPVVVHGDVAPASSAVDDVEVPDTVWSAAGDDDQVWARAWNDQGWLWHGADLSRKTDTWIASPTLEVAADEAFVVTFEHAYSFEFSDATFWDGGVIEISSDDGKTWTDVTEFGVDPGYGGAIESSANPLDGRDAFVDKNAQYPDLEERVLDFGDAFAGKKVRIRFRIGTDAAAGGPGWDLDNLAFAGITNTPFGAWITDQDACAGSETSGGTTTGGTTTDAVTDTSAAATTDASGGTITGSAPTAGSTTDPAPTTSASGGSSDSSPGSGGTTPGSSDASSGSDDSGTDSGGQTGLDDGGCACASGDTRGSLWQALPALGLLALGRRRRRA